MFPDATTDLNVSALLVQNLDLEIFDNFISFSDNPDYSFDLTVLFRNLS